MTIGTGRTAARVSAAGVLAAAAAFAPSAAEACGCFAPASPSEPVVQAGERIVFAHEDGKVVAHIQIQYQGAASDFAWLLPVPAVPDLKLGTDELFTQIERTTTPQFLLNRTGGFCGGDSGFGCGFGSEDALATRGGEFNNANNQSPPPVVVKEASAGPYDYAVVRADAKAPMLEWLNDNRYFVPANTADIIDPYIRPDAYFLALRLRTGASTGDLQPVIIEYEADNPMIPIILTQVGAIEDMGILVWVLGDDRAVPHNYQHVLINEEYIDWMGGAQNYGEVVARAVDEAEGGHAFVTEYAGSTDLMRGLLDPPNRFGRRDSLELARDLDEYLRVLQTNNFPVAAVQAFLQRNYPMPEEAIDDGVSPQEYYTDLLFYLDRYDPDYAFDPVALTADIWERVVEPTLEAGALFRNHPKMTRFYTTLDPVEMIKDPVFAFNPDLPDVPLLRTATLDRVCDDDDHPFRLRLDDGREYRLEEGTSEEWLGRDRAGVPRAELVQVLRQEGEPEVVVDNRAVIVAGQDGEDAGGCASSRATRSRIATLSLMFGLVFAFRRFGRR